MALGGGRPRSTWPASFHILLLNLRWVVSPASPLRCLGGEGKDTMLAALATSQEQGLSKLEQEQVRVTQPRPAGR